ncbi:hypothetical protein C8R46DRAFT_308732 [Mycena filopes]|nr:hypothetical protein C8R46DRAFT_308732 [Mycena filopes]
MPLRCVAVFVSLCAPSRIPVCRSWNGGSRLERAHDEGSARRDEREVRGRTSEMRCGAIPCSSHRCCRMSHPRPRAPAKAPTKAREGAPECRERARAAGWGGGRDRRPGVEYARHRCSRTAVSAQIQVLPKTAQGHYPDIDAVAAMRVSELPTNPLAASGTPIHCTCARPRRTPPQVCFAAYTFSAPITSFPRTAARAESPGWTGTGAWMSRKTRGGNGRRGCRGGCRRRGGGADHGDAQSPPRCEQYERHPERPTFRTPTTACCMSAISSAVLVATHKSFWMRRAVSP